MGRRQNDSNLAAGVNVPLPEAPLALMPPQRRGRRWLATTEVVPLFFGGDYILGEHRSQPFGKHFRLNLVVTLIHGQEFFDFVGKLFRLGGEELLASFLCEKNHPCGCSTHYSKFVGTGKSRCIVWCARGEGRRTTEGLPSPPRDFYMRRGKGHLLLLGSVIKC